MQWYALFVMTGDEDEFKLFMDKLIPDLGVRVLIPKRRLLERYHGKVHEKIKTLLPGYVLIQADMDVEFYYRIKKIPRLLCILKDKYDPVRIPEDEISVILALTQGGDVIGFSEIYKEGDAIKVSSGPLVGMEGIIESYDHRKKRLKVHLNILGQIKRVDLGANLILKEPSNVTESNANTCLNSSLTTDE